MTWSLLEPMLTATATASASEARAAETGLAAAWADLVTWFTQTPDWWVVAVIWAVAFTLFFIIRMGLRLGLRWAGGTEPGSALAVPLNLVAQTGTVFLAIMALEIAVTLVGLPERVSSGIGTLALIAVVVQLAVWIFHLVMAVLRGVAANDPEGGYDLRNALAIIRTLLIMTLSVIAFLLILDNVGVNVTTLLAGLGIGGIAVGFALQGVFKDIFGSISIVLDKPFVLGDFIVLGSTMGTVERIGLKTTRLRSLSGEQIVVPNGDLLSGQICNFKRMSERRIAFDIGVTYQTTRTQLEAIPTMVRESVQENGLARFARCHFKAYGDSALMFETVYFVMSPSYDEYMDIQQAINLSLFSKFAEAGIDFAYPTQTLHLAPTS